MQFEDDAAALKRSSWPKCDQLAAALSARGKSALPALESALTSRTHHVRSACLREISKLDEARARELAEKHLKDRAYEVRETSAKILGAPTPGE